TFAVESKADLTAREIKNNRRTLSAQIMTPAGDFEVHSHLLGRFNLYNYLAATGAALELEIGIEQIATGLEAISTK
ncbi:MAG: UDP-N-acetylmuramoyl-L-alanyl-D-glutamate--2,6-diaminopimelate ligase, partial [Deltaproteobacteria bacterium]|nr:UDP-N-acetylmuramoyl-L-alanyl-D-glutamate--2,6-diaminopimelate ligase [Deltaproteobacteria bacterium]